MIQRSQADDKVDYVDEIKPLLKRCLACHGALEQEGRLRLDTAAMIREGGDSGPAMAVRQSAESLIVQRLTTEDEAERMPPEGEPLSANDVALLRKWIDEGAIAPQEDVPADPRQHWSFQRPVRPPVPRVKNMAWVRNPIDAFVAAKHERRGLARRPPAAKHVLLRRVYIDLIGLPPTRDELQAFLADTSDDAYEKIVDKLLDSERYGERWGRHWMDVWRYSDWAGYKTEIRESQRHVWRWRDWIIESLNDEKPYDQMIIEMLAADEAAPADPEALRATAFLARNWYKFNRNVWIQNTVEHTGKALLGLTLNCSRCHDHKYDPFPQADFYRFRAFFEPHDVRTDRVPGQADVTKNGLARVFEKDLGAPTYLFVRGNEKQPDKEHPIEPGVPEFLGVAIDVQPVSLPPEAYYPALRGFVVEEMLAAATAVVQTAEKEQNDAQTNGALAESKLATARANLSALKARVAAESEKYLPADQANANALSQAASKAERQAALAKAEQDVLQAETSLAAARAAAKPDDAKAKKAVADEEKKLATARKAHEAAQAKMAKGGTSYEPLGPVYPKTSSGRRLALARWIASRENPLTARVAVNHIWLRHFGEGLVSTVFDFGHNGQPPTHPELLDWLAVEFMEGGREGETEPNHWSMKRIHRLIVLSNTYRMQSSSDDANLASDPDNRYLWRMNARRAEAEVVRDSVLHVAGALDLTMGGPELDENQGQTSCRRSIYFRHAKEKRMTMLKLFDGPGVMECYRRDESIVPQQALALANSPLAKTQTRRLAAALNGEVGGDDTPQVAEAFIAASFEQILTRLPTRAEVQACREFLSEQTRLLADPSKLIPAAVGEKASTAPADEPHLRARESLILVLLNHNDFVTVR
ncbi:MAG: multidrug transporter [Planctomycetaceae bacterium]|nr:multidrug transporter [Planctomycetaceae bacterium]